MDTPLLSINTVTYNHAPYIRQCLESILMQKTTFDFEVLVHDDASTDGTADIIREFEARYPDIIKPIYQTENCYSRNVSVSKNFQFPRIRGKYTAYCEGDDYWTDPYKLQKQVDFLESHPDYSICGGRYWVMTNDNPDNLSEQPWMIKGMAKYPEGRTLTLDNFFDNYLFWSLCICLRSECLKEIYNFKYNKDDTLYAVALEKGKGFVFPDYFGVYRIHSGGMWAGLNYHQKKRQNLPFLKDMHPHFYHKSKSFRRWYYRDIMGLYFFDITESKHILKDYWKMVKFTFSGSLDTFPYRINYFTKNSFKYFKRFIMKKLR
jgi:glycosyltransferase involved in cell wall biosynthesis